VVRLLGFCDGVVFVVNRIRFLLDRLDFLNLGQRDTLYNCRSVFFMDCIPSGLGYQIMALTLEHEQKLKNAGLIAFFNDNPNMWVDMAKKTYNFLQEEFPKGINPRPDDVAKSLLPLLEVNVDLQEQFDERTLKQKFWYSYFADLIIDKKWDQIQGAN
jgi:hypothetical protein